MNKTKERMQQIRKKIKMRKQNEQKSENEKQQDLNIKHISFDLLLESCLDWFELVSCH